MTKYAASMYASRRTTTDHERQHMDASVTAESKDAAAEIAYNEALKTWPPSDGLSGHSAVVVEVK